MARPVCLESPLDIPIYGIQSLDLHSQHIHPAYSIFNYPACVHILEKYFHLTSNSIRCWCWCCGLVWWYYEYSKCLNCTEFQWILLFSEQITIFNHFFIKFSIEIYCHAITSANIHHPETLVMSDQHNHIACRCSWFASWAQGLIPGKMSDFSACTTVWWSSGMDTTQKGMRLESDLNVYWNILALN